MQQRISTGSSLPKSDLLNMNFCLFEKENKHFRLNVTPNLKIHSAKNFKQAIKIIHLTANNFKLIGNILHVEVNFTYETERIHSF